MILSFRHKGLRDLHERDSGKGLPGDSIAKIRRMLTVIDTANGLDEIDLFPGWRLHPLRGEFDGFWSLTVTGNWRLIFRFEAGDASGLDFVDYH